MKKIIRIALVTPVLLVIWIPLSCTPPEGQQGQWIEVGAAKIKVVNSFYGSDQYEKSLAVQVKVANIGKVPGSFNGQNTKVMDQEGRVFSPAPHRGRPMFPNHFVLQPLEESFVVNVRYALPPAVNLDGPVWWGLADEDGVFTYKIKITPEKI